MEIDQIDVAHVRASVMSELEESSFFVQAGERSTSKAPFRNFFQWHTVQWNLLDYFLSVDLNDTYLTHLVWAKTDCNELKSVVTSRFTSSTVFLSLLVNTQMAVFFSPSDLVTDTRNVLKSRDIVGHPLEFMAGFILSVGTYASLCGLLANFTAWSILGVLSQENAAIILRSKIGLYAAVFPVRITVFCIYCAFVWLALFWFVVLPGTGAILLTSSGALLLVHISSIFSALGRIIMGTSAMAPEPILDEELAEQLDEQQLNDVLMYEALLARKAKLTPLRQYRMHDYHDYVRGLASSTITPSILRQRRRSTLESDSAVREMEEGQAGAGIHGMSSSL